MRHFDRPPKITFFIELNEKGKLNAIKKIPEIEKLNINIIYSSPLVRTLQSIEPYSKKHNHLVNVEYSLYEFMCSSEFTMDNYKHTHHEVNLNLQSIINPHYESYMSINDLEEPRMDKTEIEEYQTHIMNRIEEFLKYLYSKYQNTDKNILLVSHKGTINAILRLAEKQTKNKITRHIQSDYELGKITELPTLF